MDTMMWIMFSLIVAIMFYHIIFTFKEFFSHKKKNGEDDGV